MLRRHAAAGLVAIAVLWAVGGGGIEAPWAPSLDLRLSFRLDGLAALYSLLATGVGLVVFLYSRAYLPRARPDQSASATLRFYGWMALFMVAMVGIATAQDLILLFVFWDLTAIASYYLIAQDREDREARLGALTALLVTGVSAVLLLIGALVLFAELGTFSLPELFALAGDGRGTAITLGTALIVVAALAKSAQVPFHFWLPRAMRAPTPVSAYLHSAAMVAAGVLLIGRIYPLVAPSGILLDGLLVAGFASITVGGVLALTRDDMKQVLAYSTFSQYGYVVVLYGLGGRAGATGAALYVASHAVCKSGLFLIAGAVTEATGRRRLSELGGLARSQPLLAAAGGVCAAGVAGLPLTVGFFGDELFFKAAVEAGTAAAVLTVGAAVLTFAYMARFWSRIFLGARPRELPGPGAARAPLALVLPPALLAALVALGGFAPSAYGGLSVAAGEATLGAPAAVSVAYHLDARAENLMALCAYAGGALLFVLAAGLLRPALGRLSAVGERLGPDRAYLGSLRGLNAFSDWIHRLEVRDLRGRVAAVLLPAGVLVVAALAATPLLGSYSVGALPATEIALAVGLILAVIAGIGATRVRGHLALMLALAMVGYTLAGVYALFGAPDVALVAVLVETLFALLFLAVFSLVPRSVLEREASITVPRRRLRRNRLIAVVSGALVFVLVWGALSYPVTGEAVAESQLELAPQAHAKDVVTAILADFRGLDTLGEITVVIVAFAGVAALLRRGRLT